MTKEIFEKGQDMQADPGYQRYQELGGIINEKDYANAIERAKSSSEINKTLIQQVENMAKYAGIELNKTEDAIDPVIKLYSVLREDVRPEKVKHHHDEMSDQQIFVEALRMTGDAESVQKMIEKHPHINFSYERNSE